MRLWTTDERLAALRSYDILDTPAEAGFDDVVEIARALTGAPVALVSFVDADRQWFKARSGVDLDGTPLDTSFCALAVNADQDVLVVPDATQDPRTRGMSAVTGELGVRAYAGVLIRSAGGLPLGTVCVLDVEPRDLHFAVPSLRALARQVSAQLELRKAARERTQAAAVLRDANLGQELAMQAARLGRWDHRPDLDERFYDPRAREIMGAGPDEDISTEAMLRRMPVEDRPLVMEALGRATHPDRTGPFEARFRVIDPRTSDTRWVSAVGRTLFENGVCTRFFGVMQDVTEAVRTDERKALLAGELSHRVKNVVAMAQSVVETTLRNATDLSSARTAVSGRLRALSHAHELLLADSWDAAPVESILARALDGLGLDERRVVSEGPPVRLASGPALQLALALHELGTNAAKYGALSVPAGRVVVSWALKGRAAESERFVFSWREEGGPTVAEPSHKGFGSRILERATAAAFGGEVSLTYPPRGVEWTVTAPMAGLREPGRDQPPPPDAGGA